MRKWVLLSISLVLLLALVVVTGCAPKEEEAKPVVLKQSIYAPEAHPYSIWQKDFAQLVTEATEGRVQIELYPSAALCPPADELSSCHSGSIDMAASVATYLIGQVPLLNYTALPWASPKKIEDATSAVLEIIPVLEDALKDYNVKIIWTIIMDDNYCLVSKKEVHSPADVKGFKIRTAGGATDQLAVNWGAATVSLPASEIYSALQRGIADATILTIPSVKGLRVYEVAPNVCDFGMGLNAFVVYVNQDKWDQISSADQKAILDLVPDWISHVAELNAEAVAASRAEWTELGVDRYVPTPKELEEWKAGAKPLWENWAKSGPEAKKVVDILKKHGGGV